MGSHARPGAVALACVVGAGLSFQTRNAGAGDRRLGIVLVAMHDSSDADARRCYVELKRQFAAAYTVYTGVGRATFARRVGERTATAWTHAPASALSTLDEWAPGGWKQDVDGTPARYGSLDVVVMVDCSPRDERLQLVTYDTHRQTIQRLRLSGVTIDRSARELASTWMFSYAWSGFSP